MKTFFVLCAVLSVAFANVMPDLMDLEFEEFEELDIFEDKKDDFPITEEQLQCVDDKAEKVAEAHPDLEDWFVNTRTNGIELLDRARGCYESTGLKRKFCIAKLTVSGLNFYRKINKQLPKEHKPIMSELKDIVEKCLGLKLPIF